MAKGGASKGKGMGLEHRARLQSAVWAIVRTMQ